MFKKRRIPLVASEELTGQPKLLGLLRRRLARALADAALRLAPDLPSRTSTVLLPGEALKLAAFGRLDSTALREGRVEVRYMALDPVWREEPKQEGGMIPLRTHMSRLCLAANELLQRGSAAEWYGVSQHLHLAASLNDLSADTDLDGAGAYCRPAAEFDEANTEVAEKYLAGFIVFNLAWAAYEGAVEIVSEPFGMKQPKGARGRDLLVQLFGDKRFPHLRTAVLEAFELRNSSCGAFNTAEMRRMIATGSMAGIGAEHLRGFRNAVAHGDIAKPMPGDWGDNSRYCADNDPHIRKFHANTRIALLLTQMLMRSTLGETDELCAWMSVPQPACLVLTQLHCMSLERLEFDLPFQDAPLLEEDL